jgi:hypothetical protein
MTPELEDFFGLPARAPEVCTWWQLPHLLPSQLLLPHAVSSLSMSVPCCTCAQHPTVRTTDDVSIGAAAGARAHGRRGKQQALWPRVTTQAQAPGDAAGAMHACTRPASWPSLWSGYCNLLYEMMIVFACSSLHSSTSADNPDGECAVVASCRRRRMVGTQIQTQAPMRTIAVARLLRSRTSRIRQRLTCSRTPQQRWLLPSDLQGIL